MITRLSIQHYRSIENIDLKLGPINVFVGRNGAGKSNIIDAIRFVRDALGNGLDQAITDRHGISNIRQWSPTKPYDVSINIEAKDGGENYNFNGQFGFTIASSKEHFFVKKEGCKSSYNNLYDENDKTNEYELNRELNKVHHTINNEKSSLDCESAELFFNQVFSLPTHYLKDYIRGIESYTIFPNTLRQPQKQSNDLFLSTHGDNLASIIKRMRADKQTEEIGEIINGMKQLVPDLENVTVQALGGYIVPRFHIKPKDTKGHFFDVDQMSDGTLRVLGLLVALYQEPGPSVIALEEPEMTVHPGALQLLAEAIREVSQKRQIFLTSHSPELLDFFKPEEIVAVELKDGATTACPLNRAQKQAVRDDLFSLGQLMTIEGLHG